MKKRQAKRYRVREVFWTVAREPGAPPPRSITSSEDAGRLARDLAERADDDREHFWVLLLNTQNKLLAVHEVSVGSISATVVDPRGVFGPALREGAASIILVHSHPSGDPTPSEVDIKLTRDLVDAGNVVEVRVLDHIIVGSGSGDFISLAQEGKL